MATMFSHYNVDATEQDLLGYYEFDKTELPVVLGDIQALHEDYEDYVADMLNEADV